MRWILSQNISTYRLSESVGAIFVVSSGPDLVGRSWSENSCIIHVHGNCSVCNCGVLDGEILLYYFESWCSRCAYAPQLGVGGGPNCGPPQSSWSFGGGLSS